MHIWVKYEGSVINHTGRIGIIKTLVGGLSTDDANTNVDYDTDDNTWRTIHDYVGSLTFMQMSQKVVKNNNKGSSFFYKQLFSILSNYVSTTI